jgi:predicted PurR-regulated permease PerM
VSRREERIAEPRGAARRSASKVGPGPHLWEIRAVRDLFWILVGIALLLLVYRLRDVFLPVLLGFSLAYLFNPLVEAAEEKLRLPRALTALLLLLVLSGAAVFLIAWLVPILVAQALNLFQNLPRYVDYVASRFDLGRGDLSAELQKGAAAVKHDPVTAIQSVFTGTGRFFGVLGSVIGITTSFAVMVVLVPIYFFFFAWRLPAIVAWFGRFVPASRRERVFEMAGRIDAIVAAFFRARLLIAALMGSMFAIGWTLAGVPYAILLGFVTGLLSLVPFASIVGWPLALLLKYLDATSGGAAFSWVEVLLWPTVVYAVVQVIEGWILIPLIHRGSANLSAVTILIVVFVGGALGGVIGFVLAIPVASSIKMILEETLFPRLESWARQS